mmetsp:Transcript_5442/g.8938  ORF Transcript_5442/g.8938 Transcript_5442/m.8938 type:complete len:317 (-) Transcript_5442:81-1031(-)|eukprot:CAMPEP_0119014394 /NCGR_PEP_ID=MMETSP1176-20130426/9651_1 /TAXON_ID=265551 /ORGANISM="Synedropsis recta cf, Strain CCMP1620" /LENGTH=316 /DNA_ID=CAMNT_0006967561 /DNA_START=315 /DNA_END=1265 /DNA_ORIENTATION=+
MAQSHNSSIKKSNGDYDNDKKHKVRPQNSKYTLVACVVIAIISVVTIPVPFQPVGKPSLLHVWYYGWITALSTGLGVLPLVFAPDMDKYWIGISNAVAAGMMIAASFSLGMEGCTFDEPDDTSEIASWVRTLMGGLLGLAFILGTKKFLERHEEVTVGGLGGADARRVLLIFFVMTLHSFSEGVGIGVSFGGANGSQLGTFISASLAVHNIPEGLAIAVVLIPKKTGKLTAALWAILTSIPQPIMAVPAYLFVNYFIVILPVGLGFASGAMLWVAFFELLLEAYEDTDMMTTGCVSALSLAAMLVLQGAIDESSRS